MRGKHHSAGSGPGECARCGFMTDLSSPYQNPKEDSEFAYCAECEYPEPSAIPFGGYTYLCLNCLTLHDFAGKCRFYDELNAGIDLETTYYSGCVICGGASAWEKD